MGLVFWIRNVNSFVLNRGRSSIEKISFFGSIVKLREILGGIVVAVVNRAWVWELIDVDNLVVWHIWR